MKDRWQNIVGGLFFLTIAVFTIVMSALLVLGKYKLLGVVLTIYAVAVLVGFVSLLLWAGISCVKEGLQDMKSADKGDDQ